VQWVESQYVWSPVYNELCIYFWESCPADSHVLPGKFQKLSVRQIPKFQNLVARQIHMYCPANSKCCLSGKFHDFKSCPAHSIFMQLFVYYEILLFLYSKISKFAQQIPYSYNLCILWFFLHTNPIYNNDRARFSWQQRPLSDPRTLYKNDRSDFRIQRVRKKYKFSSVCSIFIRILYMGWLRLVGALKS